MNGGAQLSAVTRPYIRENIIMKSAQVILGPSEERNLGGSGGMFPQKFLDLRLSEMVSDALFKQKIACQCLTKITYNFFGKLLIVSVTFQDNFQKIPWRE